MMNWFVDLIFLVLIKNKANSEIKITVSHNRNGLLEIDSAQQCEEKFERVPIDDKVKVEENDNKEDDTKYKTVKKTITNRCWYQNLYS